MTIRLGYVIAYVPDVSATASFYEAAFGLQVRFAHDSGTYTEMATGSTVLAFAEDEVAAGSNGVNHRRSNPDDPPPCVSITLVAQELDDAWERAVAAGAQVVARPEAKPWGQHVGHLRDLNGLLVELATPMG